MPTKHDFKNIRIALLEGDTDVRQSMKASLNQQTYTQTFATQALKKFQTAVFNDEADLIIADVDDNTEGEQVATLMKRIRHNEITQNPFPISIAITGNSDIQNIQRIINSGFDALLLKPFSMATMIGRVNALRQHRAPFAVTSQYIGPDRRQNQRQQSPADEKHLITVPNPMTLMAEGQMSAANMQ